METMEKKLLLHLRAAGDRKKAAQKAYKAAQAALAAAKVALEQADDELFAAEKEDARALAAYNVSEGTF